MLSLGFWLDSDPVGIMSDEFHMQPVLPDEVAFGGSALSWMNPSQDLKDSWLLILSQSKIWPGILSCFCGILYMLLLFFKKVS